MATKLIVFVLSLLLFCGFMYIVSSLWFRGKRNHKLKIFFVLGLLFSFWVLANGINILLSEELFAIVNIFLPQTLLSIVPPVLLIYILYFIESKYAGKKWVLRILVVATIIDLLLLWTNPLHNDFFTGYQGLIPLTGRIYLIHVFISYTQVALGVILLFKYIIKNIKQSPFLGLIGAATLLPMALNVSFSFQLFTVGFDLTPFAFITMYGTFAVYSIRKRIFDIKETAASEIFDSLSDALIVVDREGFVTNVNPSFKRTFPDIKIIKDKTPIREVAEYIHSVCVKFNPPDIYGKLFSNEPVSINGAEITVSKGEMNNYSLSKDIVSDKGYYLGYIITMVNISNYRQMIDMITEMKHQADSASSAKGLFLSHMSHEIRTPLNAIIGMINIGMSTEDVEKKNYCLRRADSASKHLLGIINDVLDISKIEADKFELSYSELSFEKMLMSITDVASVRAEEKHLNLIVDINENVPDYIEGDEMRLSQVITNLLTNAIKFTPEKGTIVLSVKKIEETSDNVVLRIEVADSGIGISQEQQKRLFTSFSQADAGISKKFGGTGLGLAISKRIVELMGGAIWIESELGKGAKFIFTIKATKLEEKPQTKLLANIRPEDISILAVDDSIEIRYYFINIMKALKLSCDVANGGEEALEMLRRSKEKPYNIFFVEWQMPDMNGIELARKIKEINGENSIVIMISVADWNTVEKEAIAAGVKHFISKPLFPSTLINAINICLGSEMHKSLENIQYETSKRRYDFHSYTLLIAEDVDINREIMGAILEETGVSIDYAENGKIAVEMFQKQPEKYNLILMDVNMPEMDGYEATRTIRSLDMEYAKTIPIIAMTANVFKEDIEKCLESGMNDHTGKPVDSYALFGLLRNYLTNSGETVRMKNINELDYGIAWNDSLITGNTIVDIQHQEIFRLVSDLVRFCEDGKDASKLKDTLVFLVNHAVRHFTDEEALQLEWGYPDYENHKKRHDDFKITIGELLQKFEKSGSSIELSQNVNKIVVKWLVNHIQQEDKKISDYIRIVSSGR
ncbi:MAG: bacteriohemerythrin [Spirochaetaceae bacterium]|nr:bacteriohemerythrin [Spirochaetaceae bacterium]